MSPPSVAAIAISYNGRELMLAALESLTGLDYPALELVVVDNGSTDGTAAAVRAAHPGVTVLDVAENRGISWGMNHGIQHALAAGHDYLLLLNNDIEVAPDLVTELVAVGEGAPALGCVGPRIYYYDERDVLWSAGGEIRFREAVTRERGMNRRDRGQFERVEEVGYVNGCAMLVPRRAMEEVGPWDPIYHVSVEDADWCMRARRRGYRCYYAPSARLWHMVSRSTGGYRASRTYQTGRSTAIFVRRYARRREWARFWLFFCLAVPAALAREIPRRNAGAVLAKVRGLRDGLRIPRSRIDSYPTLPWPPGGD